MNCYALRDGPAVYRRGTSRSGVSPPGRAAPAMRRRRPLGSPVQVRRPRYFGGERCGFLTRL